MLGIFKMFRIAAKTVGNIREMRRLAAEMGALPMPEFFARWSAMWKDSGGHMQVLPRPPAKRMDIVTAQARLGSELPEELKMFYAQANGYDWTPESESASFASAEALAWGGACVPPLSASLRAHWDEHGKAEEEPMGVRVFTSDTASLITDDHDKLLPFSDFDEMLVLEPWHNSQATVMVSKPHKHYPVGTVLDVEGGTATRHATLRQSLAQFAAAICSVANMAKAR